MAGKAQENLLVQQDLRDFVGNMGLDYAGLAEGTNATTIKTTYAISYRIGGQLFYKAATDNIAMTACAAQAANTTCYYLVSINASGTVKLTKGTDGSTTLPALPTSEVPIGVMKIALSGGATFTSGTTDLGASNVVETWAHIGYIPASGDATGLTFA